MKILKRFLGFFLCFAMLLSVLPTGAFAAPATASIAETQADRNNFTFMPSPTS